MNVEIYVVITTSLTTISLLNKGATTMTIKSVINKTSKSKGEKLATNDRNIL